MRFHAIVFFAIVTLVSGQGETPEDGKLLMELLAEAQKGNFSLAAADREALAAAASARSQSMFGETELSVMRENIPLSTFPGDGDAMSMTTIGISQVIALPWESGNRKDAAWQKVLLQRDKKEENRLRLIFRVSASHQRLLFLSSRENILRRNISLLQNLQKSMRALVAIRKMTNSDLLLIHAEIAEGENEILRNAASLEQEQENMNLLLGREADWEKLLPRYRQAADTKEETELATAAARSSADFQPDKHPQIRQALHRLRVFEADLAREKGEVFPFLRVSAGYSFRSPVGSSDGEDFVRFGVSAPLPLFYGTRERHAIDAAEKQAEAKRKQLDQLRLELLTGYRAEVKQARQTGEILTNSLKTVIPSLKAAYQAQTASLASGTANLTQVIEADRRVLKAILEARELRMNLGISLARLDYFTAIPTTSSGDQP